MAQRYRGQRKRPVHRRIALALLVLLAALLFWHWQQTSIVTEVYTIRADIPAGFAGFRIVQLSDVHETEFGADNAVLLEKTAALQPDVIVMTGDLLQSEAGLQMVPALAKGLCAIAPTYYVTGNHEWGARCVNDVEALLTECGVTVLDDDWVTITDDAGETLVLAGVGDPNGWYARTPEQLYADLFEATGGAYTILLAHRNTMFESYAAAGFDLVLSGHGHGGLVRLPFLGPVAGTQGDLFPDYTDGVFTYGDATLVVSRGLGNEAPLFRLFNRPDLPLIVLECEDPGETPAE